VAVSRSLSDTHVAGNRLALIMAGRCLIELGDPAAAEPLLSSAIDSYAPEHTREIALYRTWLAESYARAGVLDAARRLRRDQGRVPGRRPSEARRGPRPLQVTQPG
jgi:hypothetical protein